MIMTQILKCREKKLSQKAMNKPCAYMCMQKEPGYMRYFPNIPALFINSIRSI